MVFAFCGRFQFYSKICASKTKSRLNLIAAVTPKRGIRQARPGFYVTVSTTDSGLSAIMQRFYENTRLVFGKRHQKLHLLREKRYMEPALSG